LKTHRKRKRQGARRLIAVSRRIRKKREEKKKGSRGGSKQKGLSLVCHVRKGGVRADKNAVKKAAL